MDWIVGAANDVADWTSDAIDTLEEEFSGLCTDEGSTKPKKYNIADEDILNLLPGKEILDTGACVNTMAPAGSYDNRCRKLYGRSCYPENGEFSFSSTGDSCNMCNNMADGYGCGCDSVAIANGKKVKFQRKAGSAGYKAPALECCRQRNGILSNGNRIYNNTLTCDPKYGNQTGPACKDNLDVINFCKKSSTNVQQEEVCLAIIEDPNYQDIGTKTNILDRYCNESDNMFTKSVCSEWIKNPSNQNVSVVRKIVDDYCGINNNIFREPCNTFIKNDSKINAHYDSMMLAWCENHPTDPRCACIMSDHNERSVNDNKAMQGLPQCVDLKCVNLLKSNTGLIPSTMVDPSCTYLDCKQFIDNKGLTIGDNNKTLYTMTQECGDPNKPGLRNVVNDKKVTKNDKTMSNTDSPSDKQSDNNFKLLLTLLLVIIGIVAGIMFFWEEDSSVIGSMNDDDITLDNLY